MHQRSGQVSRLVPVTSLATRTHRHGGVRQSYWKQMLRTTPPLSRGGTRPHLAHPARSGFL